MALRMRMLPPLPTTSRMLPSRKTIAGVIIVGIRRPGPLAWKPAGCRSSSPMMLLGMYPVPGTT